MAGCFNTTIILKLAHSDLCKATITALKKRENDVNALYSPKDIH
jgi:hypothetical protein